ncbi:MAG: RNA polymerase sigma factor [Alistipes sp.]|nr:RNA polymerase sigma factor [Alistipes sp.]
MATHPDITPALVEELHAAATRRAAFDRLTTAFLRPIYWHVRRLVVVHEEAEDVVQETFVKAYDRLESFRGGPGELSAWLYRIATRAAQTQLRRRKRSLFASLDEVGRELAARVADEAGPDADAIAVRFQQAVLALPLKQRLVFNLRYYDELPYAAIARILDQKEETLKVNYHHAVENLKKRLRSYE